MDLSEQMSGLHLDVELEQRQVRDAVRGLHQGDTGAVPVLPTRAPLSMLRFTHVDMAAARRRTRRHESPTFAFVGQLDRRRWCTRSSRRPCTARSFLNSSLAPPSRGSNMFFNLVRVPAQRRPSSCQPLEAPHGDRIHLLQSREYPRSDHDHDLQSPVVSAGTRFRYPRRPPRRPPRQRPRRSSYVLRAPRRVLLRPPRPCTCRATPPGGGPGTRGGLPAHLEGGILGSNNCSTNP